jgi:endoglucanase
MTLYRVAAVVLFMIAAVLTGVFLMLKPAGNISKEIAEFTWLGYKSCFIASDGRVMRPREGDSVSEGQAYAMLRAVWMRDKDTFDRCYRWAEDNLSRRLKTGDSLLAWHWKDGTIADWMPASDADVDYALSLIFADSLWRGQAPKGTEDYGVKARKVLGDILRLETYLTGKGRVYLSPWIIADKTAERFPVNPSYYSPAHFRVFYRFTEDRRWLELVDTTYYLLGQLSGSLNGQAGKGLVPDWCSVDRGDLFYPLEGKNDGFGWEAVRIPLRVAMDYRWFNSPEAKRFFDGSAEPNPAFSGQDKERGSPSILSRLRPKGRSSRRVDSGLSIFIENEWKQNKTVYCEYTYNGVCHNKYENPLFYAAYYCALSATSSPYARDMLEKMRSYIIKDRDGWLYQGPDEYYVNSLAWFADGFISGTIENCYK